MDKLQTKVRENLCEGLIIKSYRALAELLGEKVLGGNSKIAQTTNWKRYFEHEKEGNKFIITKVYDEPSHITEGKSVGNNTVYVKYIETLLLHILSQQKDKSIICNKKYLLLTLGITNKKYTDKNTRKMLIKNKTFTSKEINDFDSRAYQIIDNILNNALKSLQRRCLLNWRKELHYEMIDEYTNETITGVATDDEVIGYTSAKYEALKELGLEEGKPDKYDELRDIYFYNKSDKFYKLLTDKLYDLYSWDKTYIMYHIMYDKENVVDAIPRTESQLNKLEQKLELNSRVVNALNKSANTKYENMVQKYYKEYDEIFNAILDEVSFEDKTIIHPYSDYIEKQQQIAEELIRIQDKSLKKAVS